MLKLNTMLIAVLAEVKDTTWTYNPEFDKTQNISNRKLVTGQTHSIIYCAVIKTRK